MSFSDSDQSSSADFPWFEEKNFTGWLVQFRAHLRKTNSHSAIAGPRPSDRDAQDQPLVLTQAERRHLVTSQTQYDAADNIAYSELMKACRLNPKTKTLCESGLHVTAYALLGKLRQRFNNVDEITKAAHLLKYHSLKQEEGESGADFVDKEQREFMALQDMGVTVDDTLRLTKFIQEKTTNSMHSGLARTIYSTPAITLTKATALFEGYVPQQSQSSNSEPSVSALFCRYCKKNNHLIEDCQKRQKNNAGKSSNKNGRDKSKPKKSNKSSSTGSSGNSRKKPRYPCAICDSTDHATHLCPRKADVAKCLEKMKSTSSSSSRAWGDDDESL